MLVVDLLGKWPPWQLVGLALVPSTSRPWCDFGFSLSHVCWSGRPIFPARNQSNMVVIVAYLYVFYRIIGADRLWTNHIWIWDKLLNWLSSLLINKQPNINHEERHNWCGWFNGWVDWLLLPSHMDTIINIRYYQTKYEPLSIPLLICFFSPSLENMVFKKKKRYWYYYVVDQQSMVESEH